MAKATGKPMSKTSSAKSQKSHGKAQKQVEGTKEKGPNRQNPDRQNKEGNKAKRGKKNPDHKAGQKPSLIKRVLWGQARRWSRWWFFHRIVLFVCLLILIPVIFVLLYRPSFVHPVSTLMISQSMQGHKMERQWVAFDQISPFVYQSVISSEDGQFCFHNGVDWGAMNAVMDDLIEGERPRGASTIPMQSAKNLFLWSDRSYVRKILEVPLALLVDLLWSKKRLMEVYLNIAEWGPGIYGIEAAAQYHFKRSAKRLNRRQAALLTVILPNPKTRNPRRPSRKMKQLARLVEKRAKASGAYVQCLR